MLFFGAVTVTLDGSNLGDTTGGCSIAIEYVTTNPIGGHKEKIPVGGSGTLNFYKWNSSVTDVGNLGTGELILTGGNFIITVYDAKLFLNESLNVGTNSQEPFKVNFTFKPDASGNVIKIEP